MSIDDFFNKKCKKTKRTINAQELFEKITDGPQQQKSDFDKNADEMIAPNYEDLGEWEPIVNDDIKLDFSNMRINDLATANEEKEQATSSSDVCTVKSEDSGFAWGSKVKYEEEPKKLEEKVKKSGAYVPVHLRGGEINAQPPPDFSNPEEFPSLNTDSQEKPKKRVMVEAVDNSLTEANKAADCHRKDEPAFSGLSSSHFNRDELSSNRYSSGHQDYSSSRVGNTASSATTQPSQSGGWIRGDILSSKAARSVNPETPSEPEPFTRKSTSTSGTSKPYVIPQQRNVQPFTQNRFAQLDGS